MEDHRRTRHLVFVNAGAEVSGAERVLRDLVDLAVARGDSVTLVCPDGPLTSLMSAPVAHVSAPLVRLSGARGLQRVREVAGLPVLWARSAPVLRSVARDADALIVNSTFALPAVGLAFLRHRRRGAGPVISWLVHDTITSLKQRVVVRLGGHALSRAVAVSEVTGDSVRPLLGRAGTVRVQANGVEIPAEMPEPARAATGGGTIGILAAITPWKGHDVLLEALALLPDTRLEIAGAAFPGSGEFEAQLRARAAQPDLAGRVSFLGHVDKQDVLPRWNVLVSASTSPEAGPLGVLEAMAHGVPVVATDHGGAAEYLRDGAGVLVPPAEAQALADGIRRVLADPGYAAQLRATARARVVEKHDVESTRHLMLEALS